MNFEKFIKRKDIDKNYHSVVKYENAIAQGRSDLSESSDSDFAGLYSLRDLDFLKLASNIETVVEDRIFEVFEQKYLKSKFKSRSILLFSGPVVKSIVDPYSTYFCSVKGKNVQLPKIRNDIVVTVVSDASVLECLSIKKSNQVAEDKNNSYDPRIYYQICLGTYNFFIRKKSYQSVSEAITSPKNYLDRIAVVGSEIYVSGLFILEFYNKIQTYDPTRLDPVFEYPTDLLDIYDRTECVDRKHNVGLFKSIIDRADCFGLTNVLTTYNSELNSRKDGKTQSENFEFDVERAMIVDSQQKYSILEYLIMRMSMTDHNVILQAYRNMFMMLIAPSYKFIRPPHIFAKVVGFDTKFPSLYMILNNISQDHPIKLTDTGFIEEFGISSMYHIDMFLIKRFIQTDDEEMFVDYITRIKLIKKLSNLESKTGRMIIDWLILYNPPKIISTLIDTRTLLRSDIFRLVFLTQNFDLLDESIVEYIRFKSGQDRKPNANEQQNNTHSRVTIKHKKQDEVTDIMNDIESGEILNQDNLEDEIANETEELNDLNDEIEDALKVCDNTNCDEVNERLDRLEEGLEEELEEELEELEDELDEELDKECSDNDESVSDSAVESDVESGTESGTESRTEPSVDSGIESNAEYNEHSIDSDDVLMILATLEDVIKSGLSHSFFLIHEICPNILDDDYLRNINAHKSEGMGRSTNIIHLIKSDESLEVLQLAHKFRPDIVNVRDTDGNTPLIAIAKDYDPKNSNQSIENILVHFLANGADYDDTDEDGNTVLHILVQKGDIKLVNTILRLVPSIINHQNSDMMTAVMLAAINGDESMVYTLEGGSADTSYKDKHGNTVYHYVCSSGICPGSIVQNEPNYFGFRPSDYSTYCDDFYYFR